MQNIKCILFDCDGVLVDSETIGNQILLEMAGEYGFQMTNEEAQHHFNGKSLKSSFEYIENRIQNKLPSTFEADYRQRSFEAFRMNLKAVEGVKEFLETLDIPFCVASSGPVEKIRLNLTSTGLISFFEGAIFSSYEINSWKPEPTIFLHAASQMGFTPQECIVIEDSVSGVVAGITGGFMVYGLANDYNATKLQEAGALTFRSYKELNKMLKL